MTDTIQQSIDTITAAYKGKSLMISKKEKYQAAWQPSPMAQGIDIIKVPFTYEIMRVALYFLCTEKLKAKSKAFTINPDNAARLKKILQSITGDITGQYDPYKGIFMYGPPSSGKTFIMQSISEIITKAYYTLWYELDSPSSMYRYKDITMRARENGSIDFLRTYFDNKNIIFLDDLGYNQESQLNLYGTKEDIVSHLVEILYRKYTDHGASVHITSNLTLPVIHNQFGQYTHDRIVDMCTPVSWMGDNFRV